jgi:membrane protein DedA with SNARE-associated domain
MQTLRELLARYHYLGLFAILLAEESGIPLPVPGDVFIAAMGAAARSGDAAFLPTLAVVTGATLIGATILYTLARHGGRPLLLKVARRFGYTEEKNARLEGWLARRGWVAVVVGRLTPGLRIVMTVVAGALRMDRRVFTLGTAVAGALWATIYFSIGWALGAGYERVGVDLPVPGWALAVGVALLVAVAWLVIRRRRRRA